MSDAEGAGGAAEDGAIFEVEGYDDRYLRLWPIEEAPEWACEALGVDDEDCPQLEYVMFIPASGITHQTPDDWWAMLLRPAMLDCPVKSVDEDGGCVLGLASAL